FWHSSADDYVGLARATASALRAVDPQARMVLNFVDQPSRPEAAVFQERVLAEAADVFDVFGWHYGDLDAIARAQEVKPEVGRDGALWNTEAYGVPRRLISRWLEQRVAGVERFFPFIYHLPEDDAALGLIQFGLYPVNVDYTPRPDAIALRTLSDLV